MAVTLIVCEQRGTWATALRRTLAGAVEIVETRSPGECRRAVAERGPALVAVEFAGRRAADAAELVAWIHDAAPASVSVVLAERRLAGCRWQLRELGATHVVVSPRRLEPLQEIARRLERRWPPSPTSWTEKRWASLPWSEQPLAGA